MLKNLNTDKCGLLTQMLWKLGASVAQALYEFWTFKNLILSIWDGKFHKHPNSNSPFFSHKNFMRYGFSHYALITAPIPRDCYIFLIVHCSELSGPVLPTIVMNILESTVFCFAQIRELCSGNTHKMCYLW